MSIRGFTEDLLNRRPGQKLSFTLAFVSLLLYVQIGYFTQRTDTALLLGSYTLLFALHLWLTKSILSYKFLIGFGILFRFVFLFSIPNLSDDFYRFFWDGILIDNKINPFQYLPREIIENPGIKINALDTKLFESLNSPDYYTVYPPVCQFVCWISAALSNGNIHIAVLLMKVFMFLAELGSIYIVLKLLKIYKLRREYIFFYVFNPLLIIELVGNIHFESFMIFFVLCAVYFLKKRRLFASAFVFALAISSKLIPVLMLPFFLKRLKLKRSIVFYILTLGIAGLTFMPFSGPALLHGMGSSIGLYFQKFEFNASIFYIIREIGFWIKGWDIIQIASKWLALSTVLTILFVSMLENTKKQNLPGTMIWPLFIYFAFASIVHPWYAAPILAFCWFSKFRFPVVWSYTIFLSYAGYTANGFQEQLWVLLVEYILVYGVMIFELIRYKDFIQLKNPWRQIVG
ncbi:MAG: hypothetical protein MI975_00965 [Cytophagales bacterium]|nr:hypothetical protein [Cytophagales bacterium]